MLSTFIENKILIVLLFFCFCLVARADNHYPFTLGFGGYIYSYPDALDPYGIIANQPEFAPQLEISVPIVKKISLLWNLSRQKITGSLYGFVDMQQYSLLNIVGLGCDYNFGDQRNQLRVGLQMLGGFSRYGSSSFYEDTIGLGSCLYTRISRPITGPFAWGINMGILALHIKPVAQRSYLTLFEFTTGMTIYVLL
jgi:hypothetical protein